MFCPNCGSQAEGQFCPNCGKPITNQGAANFNTAPNFNNQVPPVHSPLGLAIFSFLFCLPCGLAAICYANKVNHCNAVGDYAGARSAADTATTWAIFGIIGGVILTVVMMANMPM